MRYHRQIILSFSFLLIQAAVVHAQEQPDYPVLYPSSVSAFDLENGMPISCTFDGLVDQQGRLWVNPCYRQSEHQTINFYQFSGRRSEVIQWDSLPAGAGGQATIFGMTELGSLYGFFRWSNHFFVFDPVSRQTQFYELAPEDVKIFFMSESPDFGLIVMAVARNRQYLYQLKEGSIDLLLEYPFNGFFSNASNLWNYEPNYQVLINENIWFFESPDFVGVGTFQPEDFRLNRFDLREQKLTQYTFDDLFSGISVPKGYFRNHVRLNSFQDKLLIADREYIFLFDPETETLTSVSMLLPKRQQFPALTQFRIEKDAVGNVLFVQNYDASDYRGVLLDTAGRFFDYSLVLQEAINASRFPWMVGNNVWSKDFKRSFFTFHQGGVIAVDLQMHGSIRTFLTDRPARSINEWTWGKYLVKVEGLDNFDILNPDSIPAAVKMDKSIKELGQRADPLPLTSLVKSTDGYWWFSSGTGLVRMDSVQNYRYFPMGFNFDKFVFLDEKNLAIPGNNQLYRYNIDTRHLQLWEANGGAIAIKGTVNDMYVSKDSMLWIASLQGLWQIDIKKNTSTRIGLEHGFMDDRMMCIHQDEQGLLWIGTYGGGLHIYDPETRKVEVIDQSKGLSNNTVIGILADDAGDLWVATYKGLNLISPEGEVKAQLFEEDGLSTNEFNRYSYYKDDNGRLFFGSIRGVNLLEPATIKSQIKGIDNLKIYLTGISYYDPQKEGDQEKRFDFEAQEEIKLPATHRYLNIQFALSSLIRPEDQSFEYQVREPGQEVSNEWVYLGNEPQLTLQNIPPGNFSVHIRGMDYRGNQTKQAVVIPVRAGRFFYQQAWFYALSILLFMSLVAVWIFRQNNLRKVLQRELEDRTAEIMSTRDQLIAQEKLASLGQLVAGIAHEIKNPLNFINNFSKVNRDLLEELKEELLQYRSDPTIDKYRNVEDILNEMDDASAGVINNGQRANQIVRSMMDHARGTQSELRPVNLNELVEDNLNLAYHGFRAIDPSFTVNLNKELDSNVGKVSVYPQEMGRALLNILNNAFFAVNKKRKEREPSNDYRPTIQVTTRRENEQLIIQVRDNGPGISKDLQEKIFLPFFTTKSTGAGNTGLGLSISNDIITHRHQGKLTVESEVDNFTLFSICLPVK